MQELKTYIDLKAGSSHAIILDELIEHFARRPYGWPEWEIVILVAHLYMAGEIHLILDGAKIPPKEAIEPLNKTTQWKSIKLLKRKTPGLDDLKAAKKLGQDLFGALGPEGTDALSQFLRKNLTGWRKDLTSFKPLADTGNYPGKTEIQGGIGTLDKVLAISDTYEFIKAFNDGKADLLDLSDDMHDLTDFYRNQIQTWEALRKAVAEFKPNQTILEKDDETARALRRMGEILAVPSPYKLLKEVTGLIAAVKSVNDAIIDQERQTAEKELDQKIDQITALLDLKSAPGDLRNRSLYPLQDLKKKIYVEASIPHISYLLMESQEKFDEAVDLIEESTKPGHPPGPGPVQPKPKQTKVIKPAHLTSKAYLETERDVEDYLKELRETLMAAIKSKIRVRIQ
jgi:hypothetical protein